MLENSGSIFSQCEKVIDFALLLFLLLLLRFKKIEPDFSNLLRTRFLKAQSIR